jgi:hypothetical protein
VKQKCLRTEVPLVLGGDFNLIRGKETRIIATLTRGWWTYLIMSLLISSCWS